MKRDLTAVTVPDEFSVRPVLPLRVVTTPPRVLVVEDDEEMRAWLEETLREAGYVTTSAGDPLSAVFALFGNGVDAIVTDWRMPAMDGVALLDAVRRCSPEIPVIFVTAFPDDQLRTTAMEHGAFCFLAKPFRGSQLVELVRSALDSRAA